MMTIDRLATIAAALLLGVGVAACNPESLTRQNTDPNNPTDAPPGPVFTNAVRNAVNRWLGSGYDMNQTSFVTQQLAQTTYPTVDSYVDLQAASTSGTFDGAYSTELSNLEKVIEKGEALERPSIYGPAEVMQAWVYGYVTDSYGDVPYSEALRADKPDGAVTPKYDPQKDIYAGLLQSLGDAATAMAGASSAAEGLGSADIIYDGDLEKWQRFANSLRARLALRLVNVDEATASTELAAAFAGPGGVFQSNADNATLVWPGDGVYDNPWTNANKGRDDRRMSRTLMNILIASDDPRTGVYAQPVEDSTVYPNGYGGMPNGLLQDSSSKWFSLASRPGLAFYPGVTSYGTFGTSAGLATPSYVMTYAEVMFIKAEAAQRGLGGLSPADAEANYKAAITASLQQWGITDATTINNFLAEPEIAYKGGVDGLKQIAVQKWVALFTDGGQAWAEWRRTCQPTTLVPGPAAIVNYIPRRFFYSTREASVNAESMQAAIARQGPDNFGTRVYWDSNPSAAPTCTPAP
ncbi:MAG TPA: SusD/RagB family nutrient-binding outer membrane lipoprotein [Gemmatimonadaceae bacterium]|nr:SusD/RagB family nutrient-binding outer membrane lipoprotein [Gemmatimonadaceae bacterium]